ncbi:MAG: immunoglobulin domain-containing protein [Candidatus Thiodiazotropha sp.]
MIPEVVRVILSDDVSLNCASEGNPSPTFRWVGHISTSSTLELMNIHRSSGGQYTCTATNMLVPSLGASKTLTVSKNITIDVMCKYILSFS